MTAAAWTSAEIPPEAASVLKFWFGDPETASGTALIERQQGLWWQGSPKTDAEIQQRFSDLLDAAARDELRHWADTPWGRLALVIVCDQFPRNIYRGTARAFAWDGRAQQLTLQGVGLDHHVQLPPEFRSFLLMPLMHSEQLPHHDRCVELFEEMVGECERAGQQGLVEKVRGYLQFEHRHRDLIARFGRYPYRNSAMGRDSTPEEQAYVASGGDSFGQGES